VSPHVRPPAHVAPGRSRRATRGLLILRGPHGALPTMQRVPAPGRGAAETESRCDEAWELVDLAAPWRSRPRRGGNRPGAGRSRPRSGRADEERLFPSDPRSSVRGETVSGSAALLGRRSRRVGRSTFGSSAAREGPVALRPGLASGLPLSCRLWSPTGYPGSCKGQIEAGDWAWKRFPAAHMCVTSMVLQRMVGVPTPR